tara:strand:+ start:497 stop:604 length:108 start_codon:yes stop_codon:yes gene_type:complete
MTMEQPEQRTQVEAEVDQAEIIQTVTVALVALALS